MASSVVPNKVALQVSDQQFSYALEELERFVAIPSISNPDSEDYKLEHLQLAAAFVKRKLDFLNFKTRLSLIAEGTAPYVIAEKIVDATKPTILLYAHYDVQPVERSEWATDPFKLTRKGDRLYGRGASDDKAGVISILTALRVYQEAGVELPINLRILVEGDEEFGSLKISDLLKKEAARLKAQALVVLDGANRDTRTGTIENSSRGVLTFELRVKALEKPVHSGTGGLAPDPVQALAGLIASLKDPRQIDGFMDDCEQFTDAEVALLDKSSQTAESYAKENGVVEGAFLRGNRDESIYKRIATEPSISVVNFTAGRKGGGNSIQDQAMCTLGIRLTPGQDPERIEEVIRKHLASQSVEYHLPYRLDKVGLSCKAWRGDLSRPFTQAFLAALAENYDETAVMPTGGALPLITDFEETFDGIEAIIAGVEDPETAAHSHNESQDIGILRKTTDSLIAFLDKARDLPLKV